MTNVTNPRNLPWPQDPQGSLLSLKKGGVEAARRVNGNDEKLEKLLQTLRIIRDHAKACHERDKKIREEQRVKSVAQRGQAERKIQEELEQRAKKHEEQAREIREKYGLYNPEVEIVEDNTDGTQ